MNVTKQDQCAELARLEKRLPVEYQGWDAHRAIEFKKAHANFHRAKTDDERAQSLRLIRSMFGSGQ